MWKGSAAIVKNEKNELLMVFQAEKGEQPKWSVPSGQKKSFENYRECCKREVKEETGFTVSVTEEIIVKKNMDIEVKYYHCIVTGGDKNIQDPDELIVDVQWVSKEKLKSVELSYEEDREFLQKSIIEK